MRRTIVALFLAAAAWPQSRRPSVISGGQEVLQVAQLAKAGEIEAPCTGAAGPGSEELVVTLPWSAGCRRASGVVDRAGSGIPKSWSVVK